MLSTAAFNALLKTLEEPPSHVVFVLCTTDPQKVPETIHSRCQRFDFHRLSNDEIASCVGAVCMAEGVEFEGDALDTCRASRAGRNARRFHDPRAADRFGGKVTLEVAQSVLGSIDATDISTVVNDIVKRDAAACFTWLSEDVVTGADWCDSRALGRLQTRPLRAVPDRWRPCGGRPSGFACFHGCGSPGFRSRQAVVRVACSGGFGNELRTSTNPRLSFEIALTRMVRPESDLTLEALAARIAALEQLVASGSLPSLAAISVETLRPRVPAGNPSVRPSAGSASPIRNQESISDASHPFVEDGSNPMNDARFFDFRVERACSTRDFAASDDAADAGVGSPRIRGISALPSSVRLSPEPSLCGCSSRNGDACCCGNG